MSEQIILDEPYAIVRANTTVPYVLVQLRTFANRDQFKHLMNMGLAYYKAHTRPTRRWGWIADTRQMSAIPQEVQQWLAETWNVQAYEAGLREISIITSSNILGRLATQQYAEKAVAHPDRYVLEPVYYESLEAAEQQVARRCATLSAG